MEYELEYWYCFYLSIIIDVYIGIDDTKIGYHASVDVGSLAVRNEYHTSIVHASRS